MLDGPQDPAPSMDGTMSQDMVPMVLAGKGLRCDGPTVEEGLSSARTGTVYTHT